MRTTPAIQVSLVAAFLLGLIAAPPVLDLEPVETATAQVFKPHGPIKITHNNDFRNPGNGVSGHGTSSSPYIIEGWEFTANTSTDGTAPAIWIAGTSAHFVIRNCRFDMGPGGVAIRFEDMSNGVVSDNAFLGNDIGIQATRTGVVTLQQNRIEASTVAGMILIETGMTIVKKNTFTGNTIDIQLNTTEKGQILENKFTVKGLGVDFSEGAFLKLNGNTFTGVGAAIGARIDGMDAGEIKDNKFEAFTKYGLQLQRSNRVTVQGNEFLMNGALGDGAGVIVQESSTLQMVANKANNNKGRGIYLIETSQSWIKDGEASGNSNDGIELRRSSYDGIRNMQVNDNGRSGINLNESSNNVVEANTVLRNKVADNGSIIVGGNTNKILKNEVAFSGGFGILITMWMSGNQILANNVHDNKRDDFYSDADPNQNIVSDEEIVPEDNGGNNRRAFSVPAAPIGLVALALVGLAFAMRRRRA